jgi:hypothetical protein
MNKEEFQDIGLMIMRHGELLIKSFNGITEEERKEFQDLNNKLEGVVI